MEQHYAVELKRLLTGLVTDWGLPSELVLDRVPPGAVSAVVQTCRDRAHYLFWNSRELLNQTFFDFVSEASVATSHPRGSLLNLLAFKLEEATVKAQMPTFPALRIAPQDEIAVPSKTSEKLQLSLKRQRRGPLDDWVKRQAPGKRQLQPETDVGPPRKSSRLSFDGKRSVEVPVNTFNVIRVAKSAHPRDTLMPSSAKPDAENNDYITDTNIAPFKSKVDSFTSATVGESMSESVFSTTDQNDCRTSARTSFNHSFTRQEWEQDAYHLNPPRADFFDTRFGGNEGWAKAEPEANIETKQHRSGSLTIESVSQPLEDLVIDEREPFACAASDKMRSSLTGQALRFDQKIRLSSGFGAPVPPTLRRHHLRARYEITRISSHCGVSLNDIGDFPDDLNKYDELWNFLRNSSAFQAKDFPEKCKREVWRESKQTFSGVSMSAELLFNDKDNGDPFFFRLKPLHKDDSHRFGRKFGDDRFMTVEFPSTSPHKLPRWLKGTNDDELRMVLAAWLTEQEFDILGLKWKVFFIAPPSRKRKTGINTMLLLHLFAIDGQDFIRPKPGILANEHGMRARPSVSRKDMLQWYMDLNVNYDSPSCKAFARIKLGLSRPKLTVLLQKHQIRKANNIIGTSSIGESDQVMNDGCSVMSRSLATHIASQLKLNGLPSAFQGRIGSAKGLWIVDCQADEWSFDTKNPSRSFWIEINQSQTKYELSEVQSDDELFRTFEVLDWSRNLETSSLNVQFIPILEHGGVKRKILAARLRENLKLRVQELSDALDDPVVFRKWSQDHLSPSTKRGQLEEKKWLGGMPEMNSDRIVLLLESGFHPRENWYLGQLAYDQFNWFCDTILEKLRVSVPQSCNCFCVADPLGVLGPGEVHLGFSGQFESSDGVFQDTILNARDVLVARSPAHLPSDIQRVRCVFKPELARLKDVIVFPTRGPAPLASLLSGGDYDGDRVWVCWDNDIVQDFQNSQPQHSNSVKLRKDTTRVNDHLQIDADEPFFKHCFDFSLRHDLLGQCTMYKERLCYRDNNVGTSAAYMLSELLSNLVDARKQGLIFSTEDWETLRNSNKLPASLSSQAYESGNKNKSKPSRGCIHVNDHLYFEVAMPLIEELKTSCYNDFKEKATRADQDLTKLWRETESKAQNNIELKPILQKLLADLLVVHKHWTTYVGDHGVGQSKPDGSYPAKVRKVYDLYEAVVPLEGAQLQNLSWVAVKENIHSPHSDWKHLKASAVFYKFSAKGKFPWLVAGRELGTLKASTYSDSRMIVGDIRDSYKVDSKKVEARKRFKAQRSLPNLGILRGGEVDPEILSQTSD